MAKIVNHEAAEFSVLDSGWHVASLPAAAAGTHGIADLNPSWLPAPVPGTVADAWLRAGSAHDAVPRNGLDHWYRLDVQMPAHAELIFDGLATLSEIWIDGVLVATSRTMFRPLSVTVPPPGGARLELCFRALHAMLSGRRSTSPPRWRGRLADSETLREQRTTLMGHMPGWDGGAQVIGPWRPVRLRRQRPRGAVIEHADIRAEVVGATGEITVRLQGRGLARCAATLSAAGRSVPLKPDGNALSGVLQIPEVKLWWPHTHGEAALFAVTADLDGRKVDLGRVGFRTIRRRDGDGFGLLVNGVPVFCRGAIWTGPAQHDAMVAALVRARDAGMNMLRVPGFGVYADGGFLDACDALGILVWHDFMFARFDYPATPAFLDEVRAEARAFLDAAQTSPALAVLCGGLEVAQAAAMAGRPAAEWSAPLFDTVLAEIAGALRPDIPYLPNAPGGGSLPFAADAPVTHYFGVGGYQLPLDDLRIAGVNFAAACLAFANPPDPAACRALGGTPGDPAWRAGVPRDLGSAWDFEDVRDHYLRELFGLDPASLRRVDTLSWLAHGRAAVALLMEAAVSAWRTDGRCAGAVVLMLQDRAPCAGWGVVGHDGRPKSAWHALRRASQKLQVVLSCDGMNGVTLHAINETAAPREIRLRLRGLAPGGTTEELGSAELILPMHGAVALPAHTVMGRWRDLAHVWRFGPPSFTVLGATLTDVATGAVVSESTCFPTGPALPRGDVGLLVEPGRDGDACRIAITASGFAQFVQVDDDHYVAEDDCFHLWPGETRMVALTGMPPHAGNRRPAGTVSALNGLAAAHYRGAA